MTPSGIEPATFRLVTQCLNLLRYRVQVAGDRNVINKEVEKILKYKNIKQEIQRMRYIKTKVIQ
jgi:hypothetical protein